MALFGRLFKKRKRRTSSDPALSRKQKLLLRMRRYARNAAHARLAGNIRNATFWDDEIKKVYREAKREGLREGPFVTAEEKGRELGGRRHRYAAKKRTSSDPKRTKRESKRGRWIGSFGVFWSPIRQQWTVLYSPKHHIDSASVLGWYDTKKEAERVAEGRTGSDPRRRAFAQQKRISRKIRLLRHEGYGAAQATAIAYRMEGVSRPARRTKRTR
jgi:hypothetical protein